MNNLKKTILVAAADRGGWNAWEPVMKLALDEGQVVRVILSGTCAKQLVEDDLKLPDGVREVAVFRDKSRFEDQTGNYTATHEHDLLVLPSSQSPLGTALAVAAGRESDAPIVVIEDMYLSSHPMLSSMRFTACRTCVIDKVAMDLMGEVLSTVHGMVATGGPHFDNVPAMKAAWDDRRRELREKLYLEEDEMLFLVVGGLNGTAELCGLPELSAKAAGIAGKIIVREHPRASAIDQWVMAQFWASALQPGFNLQFIDEEETEALKPEELLPAVDCVISGYSTVNHTAVLCGMPGVVYVGTSAFRWDLQEEKDLEKPPEVSAGAAWHVTDPLEMDQVMRSLKLVRAGKPPQEVLLMHKCQEQMSQFVDGHAAERVWAECRKAMGM